MLVNQTPFVQTKTNETGEAVYSNDQDDKNTDTIETLHFQVVCQGS